MQAAQPEKLMALVQALAHDLYARDEATHKDRIRAYKLK